MRKKTYYIYFVGIPNFVLSTLELESLKKAWMGPRHEKLQRTYAPLSHTHTHTYSK